MTLRQHTLDAAVGILLTLWVGGLWVTGLVVAPVLFAELESRALAGTVAGRLFELMSYIGLVCGCLLLIIHWLRHSHVRQSRWQLMLLIIMLIIIMIGEFILAPLIAGLRLEGLVDSPRFGQLHALAAVLYLFNCVLGLLLVAMGYRCTR